MWRPRKSHGLVFPKQTHPPLVVHLFSLFRNKISYPSTFRIDLRHSPWNCHLIEGLSPSSSWVEKDLFRIVRQPLSTSRFVWQTFQGRSTHPRSGPVDLRVGSSEYDQQNLIDTLEYLLLETQIPKCLEQNQVLRLSFGELCPTLSTSGSRTPPSASKHSPACIVTRLAATKNTKHICQLNSAADSLG